MSFSLANPFVSALLGALVGLAAGWLWRNQRVRELDRDLASCRPRAARLHQVEEILAERNGELAALQTELGDLREAHAKAPVAAVSSVASSAALPTPQAPQQSALPLVGESPKRRKAGSRASS
ncbi:MAG TPA: hypothetical protein VGS22_07520 [Thermoanaerobaculia bacterium]|jgi:hypothetical protein|nr:hypothetical protein [Thermoanaerobaculia bacterium]